jgi:predicted metalloprotease with PDZ domain
VPNIPLFQRILAVAIFLVAVPTGGREATGPIHYTVEVTDPASQLFHVSMRLTVGPGKLRLAMPASTPGAYLQTHARHVSKVRAVDGQGDPVLTQRVGRQTWEVEISQAGTAAVHYDVRVNTENELRLTTNWLNEDGGFFYGTTLFLYSPERLDEPVSLQLKLPAEWRVVTPLTASEGTTFRAASYHELVDSPVQFGRLQEREIVVGDLRYRLVFDAPLPPYDEQALEERILKVVGYQASLFGGAPFQEYLVLFHWRPDLEYGGGLARRHAMVMNIGKEWMEDLPRNLVGTFAHEFFHAWNFASIRPRELDRYDYAGENSSTAAWFIEGVTNYYVYLTFARTGQMREKSFLSVLSADINSYESSPGRGWLSLAEADAAAWAESLEGLDFRSGGAVVGFLLDLSIRQATDGRRSLDDVLRVLFRQSQEAGYRGYTPEALVQIINEVAGTDLSHPFYHYVNGKDPIDYESVLAPAGLALTTATDAEGHTTRTLQRRDDMTPRQATLLEGLLKARP